MGNLFGLLMDGDVFVQVCGMHVGYLVEPVCEVPLATVLLPPGGLHGVLGIGFCIRHGCQNVNERLDFVGKQFTS